MAKRIREPEKFIYSIEATLKKRRGKTIKTIQIEYQPTPDMENKINTFIYELMTVGYKEGEIVKCQNCGTESITFHTHHIVAKSMTSASKLLWLCSRCHGQIESSTRLFLESGNLAKFEKHGINKKLAKEIIDHIEIWKRFGYIPGFQVKPFALRQMP